MRRIRLPPADDDSSEEPLINLTPLIDVVFVVLIAFMLVAPVLDIDIVELAPGGPSSQSEAVNTSLNISIRADHSIWFLGKQMSLAELEKNLRIEKMRHPGQIPQIAPDQHAHFGTYQAVKNTLEVCGFTQMDVLVLPP